MTTKTKKVLRRSAAVIFLLALVAAAWVWKTKGPILKAVAVDLKAAAKARHAARPYERFLELRYGALTEATNRQQAFLSFFDPAHIEAFHVMVSHMKPEEKPLNIGGMAKWIANYRKTMSPAEKEALRSYLQSPAGRVRLKQATAKYLSQDAHYRAATAPVIAQLMATLNAIEQP